MQNKKLMINERQVALQKLKDFINENYVFRYNILLQAVEVKKARTDYGQFRLLDKRLRATIVNDAIMDGIEVREADVKRMLDSLFVMDYDPINDFLANVGTWDGKDRIGELARRVNSQNQCWIEFFHKWFLGMVNTWMGHDTMHANSLVPVIVGKQGSFKSTFCRSILPEQFRYAFAEQMQIGNQAETVRCMGRFALINLDEFDQLNERRQAILKNVTQTPISKVRKLYSNNIVDVRRFASFIATSNHIDLLTDTSGSRRFICVEVDGMIDMTEPIDYCQLYAQAKEELSMGKQHWLDADDEKRLEQNNKEFRQVSPLMQMFNDCYCKPVDDESGVWVTPLEMVCAMNKACKLHLDINKSKSLGRELRAQGLKCRRVSRGVEYWVSERKE